MMDPTKCVAFLNRMDESRQLYYVNWKDAEPEYLWGFAHSKFIRVLEAVARHPKANRDVFDMLFARLRQLRLRSPAVNFWSVISGVSYY